MVLSMVHLLRHLRLEDGRRRGGRLGADPGGAARRGRTRASAVALAGGLRGDGGDHSALHQSDHPRLRRQPFDRRPVHGGTAAGRPDGARADRASSILLRRRRAAYPAKPRCRRRRCGSLWRGAIVTLGLRRHHLRRLPVRDCDRDRDFRLRRALRARRRRRWRSASLDRAPRRAVSSTPRRARGWCCSSSPRRSRSPSC